MRVVILLLLLVASIVNTDVIGQSGQLYIEQLVGGARINGAPTQVHEGLVGVSIGDTIETGSCSQAQLHTSNGSLLMGPNASLTINAPGFGSAAQYLRLQLHRGGFSLETPRVQANLSELVPNVILQTPEAEITAYYGLIKVTIAGIEGTLVMDVHGQATIRSIGGNIVATNQYGARIVQLRDGSRPEQFDPGANPLLGLLLNSIQPPCVDRALGNDSNNFLTDVTGLSFCEGPGWENCTDRQRIHEVIGIEAIGEAGKYMPVQVRAVEVDGSAATPGEGWEISHSIYKSGDVSSPIKNTIGRLRYDKNNSAWHGQIRSPGQSGKYEVYLTLYCSRRWERCGTYRYIEWKEKIPIEVVCNIAECNSLNPRQATGSYITSTESNSTPQGLIRRANGDLVALVQEFGNQTVGLYSTVSSDQGHSWLALTPIGDFILGSAVTETTTGELILVALCPKSSDWCFYQSRDAQTWTQASVLSLPDPVPALPDTRIKTGVGMIVGPMSSPPFPESIIQDRDGTYLVSYMSSDNVRTDVYVRQSRDLKQWSDPVRISAGQGVSRLSRLLQRESGTYVLAYYSQSHESIIIAESPDGVRWTVTQTATVGRRPSVFQIVEEDGQIGLLLAVGANVRMIYPGANAAARPPLYFGQVQGDIMLLTVLENNQLLGAAFIDHSDERQDVLFTTIRVLRTN